MLVAKVVRERLRLLGLARHVALRVFDGNCTRLVVRAYAFDPSPFVAWVQGGF